MVILSRISAIKLMEFQKSFWNWTVLTSRMVAERLVSLCECLQTCSRSVCGWGQSIPRLIPEIIQIHLDLKKQITADNLLHISCSFTVNQRIYWLLIGRSLVLSEPGPPISISWGLFPKTWVLRRVICPAEGWIYPSSALGCGSLLCSHSLALWWEWYCAIPNLHYCFPEQNGGCIFMWAPAPLRFWASSTSLLLFCSCWGRQCNSGKYLKTRSYSLTKSIGKDGWHKVHTVCVPGWVSRVIC